MRQVGSGGGGGPRMRLVENAAETSRDRLTNSRPASTLTPKIEFFAAGGLASFAITSEHAEGPKRGRRARGLENDGEE